MKKYEKMATLSSMDGKTGFTMNILGWEFDPQDKWCILYCEGTEEIRFIRYFVGDLNRVLHCTGKKSKNYGMEWGAEEIFWEIRIQDIGKTHLVYVVELEIPGDNRKFERCKGRIEGSGGLLKFKFETDYKNLNRFYNRLNEEVGGLKR
ncbi:MAG: hypothetical protein A7316_04155 [Candidatus Altiarchaeales archaeon WOR_SM1_86-2]|nr:MAG: hypothetical protein A7316_04155 [Candidatus Altiarchaeales archaeon WOR_SM1_86-2]ODS41461.1 MAG: hypothetical protein A7315_06125 [Candidatus Altiarchaeales archaeon WOR_SM1_79]